MSQKTALVVGAGPGISGAFARALVAAGHDVHLAGRDAQRVMELAADIGATGHACDASQPDAVTALFDAVDAVAAGPLDAVLYNPSARARGAIADLAPDDVMQALKVSAFGGFLVGQAAARRMLDHGAGTILFTGASASMKGYAQSAPFAMGKFALRGLAQSMARELAPKGIHVVHAVIDGSVRSESRGRVEGEDQSADSFLDPEAIAATYMHLVNQPRSAWTWEVELRPWVERF